MRLALCVGHAWRVTLLSMIGMVLVCVGVQGGEWAHIDDRSARECDRVAIEAAYSGADSLVLHISCPSAGMEQVNTVNGVRTRVTIPGEHLTNKVGFPRLPLIFRLVAVPEYAGLSIEARGRNPVTVPLEHSLELGFDLLPDGSVLYSEKTAGSWQACPYPSELVEVVADTHLRDLRVLCLAVNPVQYIGGDQSVVCYRDVVVTLRFASSCGSSAIHGVGPFEKVVERNIIGYDEVSGQARLLGFSPGSWGRCSGGNITDCCNQLGTDYLIVSAGEFFNSVWLDSLAAKRSAYDGFNVAIVNVDDIVGPSAGPDTVLHDFIRDLYDSQSAGHMPDGHIGYVLLAGAVEDSTSNALVPTHFDSTWTSEAHGFPRWFPSDNWLACFDTTATDWRFPDVLIGRFCARDTADLRVLIDKTLDWEPLPADSQGWSSTLFLTTAEPFNSYQGYSDAAAADAVVNEVTVLAENAGYRVRVLRGEDYQGDVTEANVDSLNAGAAFMWYAVHTDSSGCWLGGWGKMGMPPAFTCQSVEQLDNRDSLCVVFTQSCMPATFVDPHCSDERHSESIGVKFVAHPGGGAVAFVGPSDAGCGYWNTDYGKAPSVCLFESIFENHTPFLAEAVLETRLQGYDYNYVESITLLGDDLPPTVIPLILLVPQEPDKGEVPRSGRASQAMSTSLVPAVDTPARYAA